MNRARSVTIDSEDEPNYSDPNLSHRQKFDLGISHYENGDRSSAFGYFYAAKSPSNDRVTQSMAHHAVGLCYFHGIGTMVSHGKALNHMRIGMVVGELYGLNIDSIRKDARAIEEGRFADVSTLGDLFSVRPISAQQLVGQNQVNQIQQP